MTSIILHLQDLPPSANHMRKHFVDKRSGKVRSAKSDAYAKWKTDAAWQFKGQGRERVQGPYSLHIHAQRPTGTKKARDIDNLIKPLSDALVLAGIVEDDSLCNAVSAKWSDEVKGVMMFVLSVEYEFPEVPFG